LIDGVLTSRFSSDFGQPRCGFSLAELVSVSFTTSPSHPASKA
jgi:hypothetical protein